MFFHTLFDIVTEHTIWNCLYVMPASQNDGGKGMQQKSERSKDRASRTSRGAPKAAGYGGSSREQRKLQAEDDWVVLLCRD